MRVIIEEDRIMCEGVDLPVDHSKGIDWSCRLASHEACAWAIKRLGAEMEKSVQFYRTGEAMDTISI